MNKMIPVGRELPIEGDDFEYVETDDEIVNQRSHNPIVEFSKGLYSGILVQYGRIEFLVDEDPPRISFDFTVLNSGAFSAESLEGDAIFKQLLGDIIISTVKKHVEGTELENRNDDPQIPSLQ
jgi:hypothetical protein